MGEDVAYCPDAAGAAGFARPIRSPGSAVIPPSKPLAGRRTSQTWPSRSIQ